jgi:hypothetical protein
MASTYPAALDDFTNPTATDPLNSETVPHATQHADLNDAVEAIEATLGVDPQGASDTVVERLDDLDTSFEVLSSTQSTQGDTLAALGNTVDDVVVGLGEEPWGSSLSLLLSQVSVDATDELVAGTDPGEVDDSAPVGFVRIDVDGTDYALAVYGIVPAAEPE